MAVFDLKELKKIPYIKTEDLHGRTLTCLTFFDEGEWRVWLAAGNFLLEAKAWPAEAFYFAREPAEARDFSSHFLNFMAQRASYASLMRPLNGLQDDFYNLAAIFAKLEIFKGMSATTKEGMSRIVVTEVEYLFSVCRSIFDLLYEINKIIWKGTRINGEPNKKQLPPKLSKLMQNGESRSSAEVMIKKFNLPTAWADFYERHMDFFMSLRAFRDNIIHNGSQVKSIFAGDGELLVSRKHRPFNEMNIWHEHELQENEIAPLIPALAFVAHQTLAACEDFTVMLEETIEFPPPLVPEMFLFVRGYHTGAFYEKVFDVSARLRAVRENEDELQEKSSDQSVTDFSSAESNDEDKA